MITVAAAYIRSMRQVRAAYDSSPDALAALVRPDANDGPWSWLDERDLGAVLAHQLDAPLVCDLGQPAVPPGRPEPTTSFRDVLHAASPSTDRLRMIKDFAKASGADGRLPQDVAHVLYYLSIAAAEARGTEPISSLSGGDLQDGLHWCLAQTWLDASSRGLLEAALAHVAGRSDDHL